VGRCCAGPALRRSTAGNGVPVRAAAGGSLVLLAGQIARLWGDSSRDAGGAVGMAVDGLGGGFEALPSGDGADARRRQHPHLQAGAPAMTRGR